MRSSAVLVFALSGVVAGCEASLPEEGTRAAELYRERCSACHRLYAPSVMKPAMWEIVVDRMQQEIARRRRRPLTDEERRLILDYLKRHSRG